MYIQAKIFEFNSWGMQFMYPILNISGSGQGPLKLLDLNCLNCLNIFVVIKRKEATLQSNQNKKVPHPKLPEPDPPNEQDPSPSPG